MRVGEAYAACAEITRREGTNFALGIKLLPKPKREALTALYAFARRVDDAADQVAPAAARREQLEAIAASLDRLRRPPPDDPVVVALGDAMVRYPIPLRSLRALVEGGLLDVERSRYASWEELRAYCERVAGAVGIACTAVYGPSDPLRAEPLAEQLGLALQQINIMRDVAEDLALGRVYLPQDELARFGVREGDLATGVATPRVRELLAHQGSRARGYLVQGLGLLDLLDHRSALCVRGLVGVYAELLAEIERRDYDVLAGRISVPTPRKLRVVGRGFVAQLGQLAGARA